MKDRDNFRAKREKPIKWQYAKVGLINGLWKPEKSSLKKKAYGHRLIYDKDGMEAIAQKLILRKI